ncbi:MAG: hypothetical protein GY742_00115 [Hyphomicrobiales bacterium]|nr:hypothetical protein [Hyphomicrobiales bacterium]
MKTSLAFLGILSAIFVASHSIDRPLDISGESATPFAHRSNATAWKLSISGIETQCTTSFTLHSVDPAFSQDKGSCANAFPALQHLAGIKTEDNGDITFYHENGSILVKFMESESNYHESFWPAQPLMTLARIN